jgi:hypothetical protein
MSMPDRGQSLTSSSSSMALQAGVGLGLHSNKPPNISIPCSTPPFVYSHLSQVCRHIQRSRFWSSFASCCIQPSLQHLFWDCGQSLTPTENVGRGLGLSGRVRKIPPPLPGTAGFNPRTVRPVASRYTD